jgi:hypothetical protein
MTKNSALERVRVRKLVEIQLKTFEIAVSKIVMLREKPAADSAPVKLNLQCRLHRAVKICRYLERTVLRGVVYKMKRRGTELRAPPQRS